MSDLVGNPEDRFSQNEAHIKYGGKERGSVLTFRLKKREVNSIQRSGTEAIRAQIRPSKPKREITNVTNSQNTMGTYGQPSEQLFPKSWPLSNPNRTEII